MTRLSKQRISQPLSSIKSQRCEPRKPAPPVITARKLLSPFAAAINERFSQCPIIARILRFAYSSIVLFRRGNGFCERCRVVHDNSPAVRKFSQIQCEDAGGIVVLALQVIFADGVGSGGTFHANFEV